MAALDVVAAVYVGSQPQRLLASVQRLSTEGKITVVLGAACRAELEPFAGLGFDGLEARSPADLVNQVWSATGAHILAVSDGVLVPPGLLDVALDLLAHDVRVATVSFWSNAAHFLSFPDRNQPTNRLVEGHDETSITRRLRALPPPDAPVPVPLAAGPAVVISSVALGAVGALEDAPSGAFGAALADFSLRGRSRGFVDLLEATTFCTRLTDGPESPGAAAVTGPLSIDDPWLHRRHPTARAIIDEEATNPASALGLALNSSRVKILGLRILVDGSCLGPWEMGTQVITVALVEALAARPDVRQVCVALSGELPAYARSLLTTPKVRPEIAAPGRLPDFGPVDVAHRPFQPNEGFSVAQWRNVADRVVVTVLDLISFHIGTYSGDPAVWLRYRDVIRESLRQVDGVVAISDDVRSQIERHRLPVPVDRLFVVPIGTEHLTGTETARIPGQLAAQGFAAEEFLLCLGTDYTHKNRDLAVRAWAELRRRGHDVALVLAGPAMPWGSSRELEVPNFSDGPVYVLPDVTSEERNWLLRHASVMLYPTSAEGFGLIPFEAAKFGTPTVHVDFGPLADIAGDGHLAARDWQPASLADAAEALLADPALAARQVASYRETGGGYTWARMAESLTTVYRRLLSTPPR